MIDENRLENRKQPAKRDVFITISIGLYIFTIYFVNTPLTNAIGSLLLYTFIGLTFVKLVTSQTPLRITPYTVWFIVFCLLGVVSFFYAPDRDAVLTSLYTLFVSLVLTFAFIQYVRKTSYILRIIQFFAYFPITLVLYVLISGEVVTSGGRLGEDFFRNANTLAMVMMVALTCVTWLIFYGERKYFWVNVVVGAAYLYVIALTGGRKFLLLPFVFLFLLIVFLLFQRKQPRFLFYLILLVTVALTCFWAVINIPSLYQIIGIRFEGLFNFLQGNLAETDYSTQTRFTMIIRGWNWYLQKPLLGYGLNNYQYLLSNAWGDLYAAYAHNNYVEMMVDFGTVGIFVYYSFYIHILIRLFTMRDAGSGLRNFFLAFILVLLVLEIGAVTYNLYIIQIFLSLSSAYTRLYDRERMGLGNE